jgi:competence ComEA-like helix-hairpin-helix protein
MSTQAHGKAALWRRALAALCAAAAACAGAGVLLTHRLPAPFEARAMLTPRPVRRAARALSPWPAGRVDVNTADAAALDGLPGIGPKLAEAIIAERAQNGPFRYPEDLLAVRGIGAKTLSAFREQLRFNAP